MTVKFIIPLAVHMCVLLVNMAPLYGAETPEDGKGVGALGHPRVEFSGEEAGDIYAFHATELKNQNKKMEDYLTILRNQNEKMRDYLTIINFLAQESPQEMIDSYFFRNKSNPKL